VFLEIIAFIINVALSEKINKLNLKSFLLCIPYVTSNTKITPYPGLNQSLIYSKYGITLKTEMLMFSQYPVFPINSNVYMVEMVFRLRCSISKEKSRFVLLQIKKPGFNRIFAEPG
jgi:hypothetical protein